MPRNHACRDQRTPPAHDDVGHPFNDAADALLSGDPDRAEQLATAALEIGTESGQPDAFGFYGAEMIGIRRQQGRYGELVPMIEQVAAENPALPVFRATLAEGIWKPATST